MQAFRAIYQRLTFPFALGFVIALLPTLLFSIGQLVLFIVMHTANMGGSAHI
ncbi:hypothetical protein [Ktedonospora formicarum]|uniref:Uncharacterized protein n=1 Tax=Ktedonospora formicarum TaxID=2778364 RepID=A0A8J3MT46_9CHLR|nr:hypothetical protein [Ktedonospora formicarum]GHO45253.1 hypothetical protein KSX_34160 [Ktedonospora formicarum]